MSAESSFIPTSSQTVGPYFRIGLEHLVASAPAVEPSSAITIQGRVLDRDGVPVSDAMLEFWSHGESHAQPFPERFRRVATDIDGAFNLIIPRPEQAEAGQAPYLLVLIFARGLLRHLVSRVYFDDEATNDRDNVLLTVPAERRSTLVARSHGSATYRWDVILQGAGETVFFAW